MNRSILIVICDFLVLSAMSLSMGLAKPSGKGPGVAESIRPVTHTFLIEQLEKAIQQGKDAAGENRKLNEALAESNKLLDQLKTEGERKDSKMEKLESALSVAEDRMARRMAELEEARKKNESLSETLAKTEAALQKTGTELGSAKTDLAAAKTDLAATRQTLASKESSLRQTQLTLEEEKKALDYSRRKLSEQTKTLQDTEKTLAVQSAELARTMRMVDEKEAAIRRNEKQIAEKNAAIFQAELLAMQKKQELEDVRRQHIAVTAELEKKNKDLQDSESKRSFTEGRLARANEEIDELKRQAGTREFKLREAESSLTALKSKFSVEMQKQAELRIRLDDTQKTAKKQEQEIRRQEKTILEKESALAVSETKLKTQRDVLQKTAAELEKANKILRNDVLTSYAGAVLPLHFSIHNDRLLKAFDLQEDFYLPAVKLSDKVFLPAALESVTGLTVQKGGYTTIADVSYTLKDGGKLAGPLYALAEDNRVVLIPVPGDAAKKVTPLTVITAERLRRRGLKDLTLFKAGKFGEQSASLDGRCSMRPDQDRFLIVRNSMRNSSEVPAEVGDFLMTKEGSFAGIVVRVVPYSAEGRADAWCWIFQPSIDLSKAVAVPLDKKPDEKHFVSFASALSELHRKITVQNRAPAE